MRVLRSLIVPFVFLAAVLAFAPAASAAPGATLGEITRDGCRVSIPVSFEDAGTYWLNVLDDGDVIDSQSFVSSGGDTHTFIWTIVSNIGSIGTGVGIFIEDAAGQDASSIYASNGSWDFEGSDEIAKACADAANQQDNWITTPATVTTVTVAPTTPTTGTTVGQNTTTSNPAAPSTTVVPGTNAPTAPNAPTTPANRPAAARPASAARPVTAKPTFTG